MREIRMGETVAAQLVAEAEAGDWNRLPTTSTAPPSAATPTRATMVRVTWSQFEPSPNFVLAGYGIGSMVSRERQFTTHEAASAFCEGLRCSPGVNNVRINGMP